MLFEHDKHHYFFEKYLRRDMNPAEKMAFEEKLRDNESFRNDFLFYRKNRAEILQEELAEYEAPIFPNKRPKNWGWLYLLISLFGIVLILDYFITNQYDESLNHRRPLISRMNFFRRDSSSMSENKAKIAVQAEPRTINDFGSAETEQENDSINLYDQAEEALNLEQDRRAIVTEEELISDSLFNALNRKKWADKKQALLFETDSILDDSSLCILACRSLFRKGEVEPKVLLTEYWKSPVNFVGFRFTGKKLELYGVAPTWPVILLYEPAQNQYALYYNGAEVQLIPDQQYHKMGQK